MHSRHAIFYKPLVSNGLLATENCFPIFGNVLCIGFSGEMTFSYGDADA